MGAYEYTNLKNAKAFDVAIQAASAALQAELPARFSPELSDFLLTTLHLDPDKRLSVADMLRHPWMALHTSVLTSVLTSALPPPPQPVPAYRHRQAQPQQQQVQQQAQQQQAVAAVSAQQDDAYSTVSELLHSMVAYTLCTLQCWLSMYC
jgi:serine/threonine protein kinase